MFNLPQNCTFKLQIEHPDKLGASKIGHKTCILYTYELQEMHSWVHLDFSFKI